MHCFRTSEANISYRKIVKQVKQMEYSVSVATIYYIQHGTDTIRENISKSGKTGIYPRRLTAVKVDVVQKIINIIKLNPPTQREMISKSGVLLGTVNRIISKYLKVKLSKSVG